MTGILFNIGKYNRSIALRAVLRFNFLGGMGFGGGRVGALVWGGVRGKGVGKQRDWGKEH